MRKKDSLCRFWFMNNTICNCYIKFKKQQIFVMRKQVQVQLSLAHYFNSLLCKHYCASTKNALKTRWEYMVVVFVFVFNVHFFPLIN